MGYVHYHTQVSILYLGHEKSLSIRSTLLFDVVLFNLFLFYSHILYNVLSYPVFHL